MTGKWWLFHHYVGNNQIQLQSCAQGAFLHVPYLKYLIQIQTLPKSSDLQPHDFDTH